MEVFFGIMIVSFMVLCLCLIIFKRPTKEDTKIKEFVLENDRKQQELMYYMQQQVQQIQSSVKQELNQWKDATNENLYLMEKNMSQTMIHGYENTHKVFSQVMQEMGKLDEGQKNLKELSYSIVDIQRVLTDKKTRGIFGEIELYNMLENVMGNDNHRYRKQYKLSNGFIADAVLFGKEPLGLICIDSKFPLENYNRLMNSQRKDEQKKYHDIFCTDVKKHIKVIAQKYIIPQETADFAYMFLPAEAIYSYIYAQCDDVVKYSYENKVYMVSPTTLMSYITAIKAIYLGVERNENLANMQKELQKLQVEFERFEKRYQNIQVDFNKCYEDMRLLSITASKLLMRFREIENVQIKDEKD